MILFRGLLLLFLVICPAVLAADTAANDAMALGRVFMTPEQRAELDRLRKIRPVGGTGATTASPATSDAEDHEPAPDSSGFIVRSEGEAYLWVDGDFRKVRPDRVRSNDSNSDDAIKITRHGRPEAGAERKRPVLEHADDESI